MVVQVQESLTVRRLLNLAEIEAGARVGIVGESDELPGLALSAGVTARGGAVISVPPPEGELGAPAVPLDVLVFGGLSWPSPLVAAEVIAAVSSGKPGCTVVFILPDDAPTTAHPNEIANELAPRLDLHHVHVVTDDVVTIVRGRRRPNLTNADRKRLRGLGHDIEPTVLIGRAGLTAEVVDTAREAVERHGLIKTKLTPQCKLDKAEIARNIAWATGSQLVQRVGKMALLFRPDVELDPPQRRTGRRRHR